MNWQNLKSLRSQFWLPYRVLSKAHGPVLHRINLGMNIDPDPEHGIQVRVLDRVQALIQAHVRAHRRPDLTPCMDPFDEISTFTIPAVLMAMDHQATHLPLHTLPCTGILDPLPLPLLARQCLRPFIILSRPTGLCHHFRSRRLQFIADSARP